MEQRSKDFPEIPNTGFGGISWNQYLPAINLYIIRRGKHWYCCVAGLHIDYEAWYIDLNGSMELIKIFHPTTPIEHTKMMNTLTEWNYGTCELCPIIKLSLR